MDKGERQVRKKKKSERLGECRMSGRRCGLSFVSSVFLWVAFHCVLLACSLTYRAKKIQIPKVLCVSGSGFLVHLFNDLLDGC